MAVIEHAVSLAQGLVSPPSPSGQERAAAELLVRSMRVQGFAGRIDGTGKRDRVRGRGLPGHPWVVIDGQVDMIPPPADGDRSRELFGAEIVDGRLCGRGVCAWKAALAAAVAGLGWTWTARSPESPGDRRHRTTGRRRSRSRLRWP
jgi:acetylornithine deacetylase/succinyl-diaminopimelate desuccinylase-like protein